MRIHQLLAFAIALIASVRIVSGETSILPQTNLVQNPGFEVAAADEKLPGGGWWVYEARGIPDVALDRKIAHSGKASVRLHALEEAKFTLVSAKFPVAPADELDFSAWVRAEDLTKETIPIYAGLAFRNAEGEVIARTHFSLKALTSKWSEVTGTAVAVSNAVSAEIHLGYTNAIARVWFDDVSAVVKSPFSLALLSQPKQWAGEQELAFRITNRKTAEFGGQLESTVSGHRTTVPVSLKSGAEDQVKLPITMKGVGVHECTFRLLDETGAAQRTLQGRFRTVAPLSLYPACPCYHVTGKGDGATRIDARIVFDPAKRAGMKLTIEVTGPTGKVIASTTADASTGDIVGANIRLPVDAAVEYVVKARLQNAASETIGTDKTEVTVGPRGPSPVAVGPDGFLRVAGEPNFPIGMYSCGRYPEMAAAGFTVTHSYGVCSGDAEDAINSQDAAVKNLLDRSWAAKMGSMVELPRKAIEKAQWAQIRHRIETFRNHPGLLCWGSEERVARGTAPLTNVVQLYRIVKELDPDHPLVLGDTRDVVGRLQKDRRNFFPDQAMDIGIWWWYPIPLRGADGDDLAGREKTGNLLQPPSWLTTTLSKKPLWIAIQSYQQPWRDARFPTPAEYRSMAYLSIINGVKGLFFYTGSGQRDFQGKPSGLLNKPEEGHWDYVQQLVRELHDLAPVIVSPAASKPEMSPVDAPVDVACREHKGKLYVLAANKSSKSQEITFSGKFGGKHVRALGEDHIPQLTGNRLTDTFAPLGVHVYEIE